MTDVLGFGVIFSRPTSARHAQKSLGKTTLRASRKRSFVMHVILVLGTGWYAFRFVGVVLARPKSARPLYFSAGHSK